MKRVAILAAIAAGVSAAFLWFLDQAYRLGMHDGKRLGYRRGFNEAMDAQLVAYDPDTAISRVAA